MPHQTGHTDHVGLQDIDRRINVDSIAVEPESKLSDAVRRAINELDDGHRLIAQMCLLDEMSVMEVARIAHLTKDLTNNILTEAISSLRQKFGLSLLS